MFILAVSTPLILFISAAGVLQAVFLALLLYFHPKSDRSVTRFLSFHILTISIFMLTSVSQYLISWQSIILHFPFQFLIGPFLYLYVRSFKERITWRKVWPHLMLFGIILITAVLSYLTWIKKYPVSSVAPEEVLLNPYTYLRVALRNIQMLVYYFLAWNVWRNYRKSIHHLYSETSQINLDWVKWLLNGFLLIIISAIALIFLIFIYPEKFNMMVLIIACIITPYLYLVTFKGIAQPTIWQIQPDKNKEKVEKEIIEAEGIESPKNGGNEGHQPIKGIPEFRIKEVAARIVQLMEEDKLYQEPELSIQALSNRLGIPSYQTSQVINEVLKRNFYDLINSYRVADAQRQLLDPKNINYTILSVGFEAGFNSKTTFHTVFKKFTGLTPTEYRNNSKKTLPISEPE